jgi:ribosomal-protein-serine acetyltransferase
MFHARLRPDLELRLLEERHAPAVFALVDEDRGDLREWLGWVDASKTEEDTRAFIRAALERFASNTGITAGIWFQERFAGVIGTHRIDWLNRSVELGYWLGSSFRGRGIMTDSCRCLLQHAFHELELNRVEIRCAAGNARSRRVPGRLGFTHEATLREAHLLHGRHRDLEVWSLLRREFRG